MKKRAIHDSKLAVGCALLASALGGCMGADPIEADDMDEMSAQSELAESSHELANSPVPLFTANSYEVNVCFFGGERDARDTVRSAVEANWGAASRLNFKGWGTCAAAPGANDMPIEFSVKPDGWTGGYAALGKGARAWNKAANRAERFQVLLYLTPGRASLGLSALHEVGHALGLAHEHQRADANRCPSAKTWTGECRANTDADCPQDLVCDETVPSGVAGKPYKCADPDHVTLTNLTNRTPYDQQSVMNYCRTDTAVRLTAWDAFGIQSMYGGSRLPAIQPLIAQFNSAALDHRTGVGLASSGGYFNAYHAGYVFTTAADQVQGTVALEQYYNSNLSDTVLVATAATRADAVAGGYVKTGTVGYAYSSQQPGTVALALYWSATNKDNFHAIDGSEAATIALAANYQRVRTEAWVFSPSKLPFQAMAHYYYATNGDNLTTVAGSTLASNALAAGYSKVRVDGASLVYNVPGTVALRQWWNGALEDHFMTTSTASFNGYTTRLADEGYVFSTRLTNMKPYALMWHSGRGDNFTTNSAQGLADAQASNYAQAADQGNMWRTAP